MSTRRTSPFPRRELARSSAGTEGSTLPSNTPLVGDKVWFSEINTSVAQVFSHDWSDAPNLGDISVIDWSTVAPVEIVIGGFPCQGVSIVGKGAGIAPGTRSGLWSCMGTRNRGVATRVRRDRERKGLLSAPATRPEMGYHVDPLTVILQPLTMQPFATWRPTRAVWGRISPTSSDGRRRTRRPGRLAV